MAFYVERKAIRKVPGKVIKAAPLPDPEVIEGFGAREQVGRICKEAGYENVLLVTDETLFSLGLHQKIALSLEKAGVSFEIFHKINSEPTIRNVHFGRMAALRCNASCIIALGGGSVMDCSKIIAAGVRYPNLPIRHLLHKFAVIRKKTLPMINIPSTAGTGAECTVAAVIKNKAGAKGATVVMGLDVSHVILDSELLINAPKEVTSWCAIDALSHGLEGLLADVKSSEDDIFKSRECVRLVLENLPVLLEDPGNAEARQATLLAAHYGGNAINTQLAGYVHAFAHSIGALYHIPHGKAIAHCLIPVLEAQEYLRYDEMSALAGHCHISEADDPKEKAADRLISAIKNLLELCGLEKGCPDINEADYHRLTNMINLDSINYSPSRTFTDSEIKILLDRIRRG